MSATPPSAFISKLWDMLSKKEYDAYIRWNDVGDGIFIVEPDGLMLNVLPMYFKGTKLCSYVRQLNIYGFVKARDQWEFKQQEGLFDRNHPERLGLIKRRVDNKKKRGESDDQGSDEEDSVPAAKHVKTDPSAVPSGVQALEQRSNTQEELIHWLIEAVNLQRSEMGELRQQVGVLTQFVMQQQIPKPASLPIIQQQQPQQIQAQSQQTQEYHQQAAPIQHAMEKLSVLAIAPPAANRSEVQPFTSSPQTSVGSTSNSASPGGFMETDDGSIQMDNGVPLFDDTFGVSSDEHNTSWL